MSGTQGNRQQKKEQVITRSSMDRRNQRTEPPPSLLPKKSENAWKSRREEKGVDKDAEVARFEVGFLTRQSYFGNSRETNT